MTEERWFYVFEKSGETGVTAYGKTTDGEIAVFAFSSHEAAKTFADKRLSPHSLYVLELNENSFIEWLRRMNQGLGATGLWMDPDPTKGVWNEIPIAVLLQMV